MQTWRRLPICFANMGLLPLRCIGWRDHVCASSKIRPESEFYAAAVPHNAGHGDARRSADRRAASTSSFCRLFCRPLLRRRAREEVLSMFRMLALAGAFALSAGLATVTASAPAMAQQQAATLPYGPPITLDQAKRAMAAAEA